MTEYQKRVIVGSLPAGAAIIGSVKLTDGTDTALIDASGCLFVKEQNLDGDGYVRNSAHWYGWDYTNEEWKKIGADPTTGALKVDLNAGASVITFTPYGNIAATNVQEAIQELDDEKALLLHAAKHTDGTDDIQDATDSQKGLATAAQITKLDGIEASADVTDATNVNAAGAVMEVDYDANTILAADSDDTPAALTIAESRLVGRISGGNIDDITIQNALDMLMTTKGDIITWSTTAARLGVGSNDQVLEADSAQTTGLRWHTRTRTVSITVEDPSDAEDITITYFPTAVTITAIEAVLIGSDTPSVTIDPKHHTDRSNAGNALLASAAEITDTTTGASVSLAGGDATIPASSFLWLETTAQSGTVTELHLTFTFTDD